MSAFIVDHQKTVTAETGGNYESDQKAVRMAAEFLERQQAAARVGAVSLVEGACAIEGAA